MLPQFLQKLLPTILFFLIFWSLTGQTGSIQGSLSSAEEPLSFATVILKQGEDSTFVKAGLTEEDGSFNFSMISYGNYFIETSYIGMIPFSTEPFELSTPFVGLPVIVLEADAAELAEVEVVAKAPLIEILADKTVFNVQNTLSATGTNGFDLLRKAPGVIIDNNDNIIVEGKTGVLIYIDHKPSPLSGEDLTNFLRSLQSTDIQSIEIITQPSSKYDAAGNAGIINIRLKKDKRLGTNGTVSAGISHGKNTRYNSSVSFNQRTKKSNLFGTYSNNMGEAWSFIDLNRVQQGIRYDSKTETINENTSNNIRLGFDIFPNDNHTFGILLNGNLFDNSNRGLTSTPIGPANNDEITQILLARNESNNKNYNLSGNLNYRFADTLGHELLLDIDYGKYDRDRVSFQPNEYLEGNGITPVFERNYRMITPTVIDIITTKLDYSQDLFHAKVSVGGKYSRVSTDNNFEFYNAAENGDLLNEDRSNQFVYTENINAAYLNINKKWQKWNLQLGLRMEQTISEGDLTSNQSSNEDWVKRNYIDWFPSGGITFTPDYKNSWALTYSSRIQRPNYQTLNPFESQLDELSFQKGNPFLQPQYTTNIRLAHTYKYRFTTSISYSHIADFFAQVTDTLGATKNFLTTRNIANQDVWNLGLSLPFQVNKWWSVYTSINAYHSSYQGSDEKFQAVDQATLSFYGQNTFTLPKGFKLEVSGWFSSPSVWGGTYQTQSMGSLDIAMQKKFMGDRLTARLSFSDVLFTSFWRADMQFGELYIDGRGGWESRQVSLNINYAFGRNEIKKSRNRKTGLEEEGKRVGN